jgi:hypothetical protein
VNTLRLFFVLGAASAIAVVAGCDTKAKCVADCDDAGVESGSESGSDSDSESGSESDSDSDSGSPVCVDANADAQAFVEANRACTTHADCKLVEGICAGALADSCGSVAVSSSADDAQWDALHGALQSCNECGANPCGATAVCTEEGVCDAQFGTPEAECAFAEQEVEQFIADNRACEVDEDCQELRNSCYRGPFGDCGSIPLNVDADLEVAEQLLAPLEACFDCVSNDCETEARCGADGFCAQFDPE